MDHTGDVICRVDEDVATLLLTRPGKHNSVTRSMWVQLTEHVHRLEEHPDVRMIVLRGEGSAFSAGADLADMVASAGDQETARAFALRVASALHALATSSRVTVAALKHHVRGGGAELALACDLRVAEEDVAFQIPVSRLGVVPDRLTTRRLSRLAGPGVARRVLLLTHELDGAECLRTGLVDALVPLGGLDAAIDRVAHDLRGNVDSAVRATKLMLLEDEGLTADVDALIAEFVDSLVDGGVAERARAALRPNVSTT